MESIDQIIADEIKKSAKTADAVPTVGPNSNGDAIAKITQVIVDRITKGKIPGYFSRDTGTLLQSLMNRAELDLGPVGLVFRFIILSLKEALKETTDERMQLRLSMAISTLEDQAVDYFEAAIAEEFKETHIIEIRSRVKATLHKLGDIGNDHLRKALENTLVDIDRRIELSIEEQRLRRELGEPAKSQHVLEENIEGSLRQRTLAILLLLFGRLEIPELKEDMRTQLISFTAFLTGQSRDKARKMLRCPTHIKSDSKQSRDRILADLREVRKYFLSIDRVDLAKTVTNEAKEIFRFSKEELEESETKPMPD